MKTRLLAWPFIVTLTSSFACFPGYRAEIVTGDPKTEFVPNQKREPATKTEVNLNGSVVNVKVWSDYTCYGNDVTQVSQKRVYKLEGVSPGVGIAVGVVSAIVFGVSFANGICDPDNPRLFDFNKNNPNDGIPVSQAGCDLITGAGTLIGFSGMLAYGATSAKALISGPREEELAPEQKVVAATQACGSEPITNVPLLLYLPVDDTVAYAWPNAEGVATFEISTLLEPSVSSGKALISFATQADQTIHTIEADQIASIRQPTWSPMVKGQSSMTGEALITGAYYELIDVDDNMRKFSLKVRLKNPGAVPITVRAKLNSNHPAITRRTIYWNSVAPGEEQDQVIEVEYPKAAQDPGEIQIWVVNKTGGIASMKSAINGPFVEPPAPEEEDSETTP